MSEQNATDTPDPVLIQRAKQGDPQAFGALYERYVDAIFRYIRTRVSDVQTAEDLSEAVFLRAFEAIERYRDRGLRYSAFLYQVARNLLVDHYRQSQEDLPLEDQVVGSQVTDQSVLYREQLVEIREALERIPEEYQEVIRLRVLLELPTVQAAEWMERRRDLRRRTLGREEPLGQVGSLLLGHARDLHLPRGGSHRCQGHSRLPRLGLVQRRRGHDQR